MADQPWGSGFFDAHCHPTDTMGSVDQIGNMNCRVLTIMATRREDQALVEQIADRFSVSTKESLGESQSSQVLPAFGWHPWFSHQLYDDRETHQAPDPATHYGNVLTPPLDDPSFLESLPPPILLSKFLSDTEARLRLRPLALVGEVGLDKSFRLPKPSTPGNEGNHNITTPGSRDGKRLSIYKVQMAHQKLVLEAQLRLAARLNRPVSMHSVQAHGAVYEVLQNLWSGHENVSGRQSKRKGSAEYAHVDDIPDEELAEELPFPPRICMHSYSGPADFLREFVHRTVPLDIYFSFSEVINFSKPSKKIEEVIRAVPDDRILMESDFHMAGPQMDQHLDSIFGRICQIKGWSAKDGTITLTQNWYRFIFGE